LFANRAFPSRYVAAATSMAGAALTGFDTTVGNAD
jgi:hypothetical protein